MEVRSEIVYSTLAVDGLSLSVTSVLSPADGSNFELTKPIWCDTTQICLASTVAVVTYQSLPAMRYQFLLGSSIWNIVMHHKR